MDAKCDQKSPNLKNREMLTDRIRPNQVDKPELGAAIFGGCAKHNLLKI